MSIAQALVEQVSKAEEERVLRALDALHTGTMRLAVLATTGVITAEVTSTVTVGKRNPTQKTETYEVLITPTRSECTCPDWAYRHSSSPPGFVCKHLIFTCLFLQEQTEAPETAPPPKTGKQPASDRLSKLK